MRDSADPQTPEHEFNRQWAMTTMETALARLAAEYAAAGKAGHFTAFRPLLDLAASGHEDYAAIAQQLGMKEGAARVAAHRVRQRFREMIFTTIAETLDQPTEAAVRAEIGLLMESLS
jgi:RNA polymerase sigma-70 factor (ECF subfamily)